MVRNQPGLVQTDHVPRHLPVRGGSKQTGWTGPMLEPRIRLAFNFTRHHQTSLAFNFTRHHQTSLAAVVPELHTHPVAWCDAGAMLIRC